MTRPINLSSHKTIKFSTDQLNMLSAMYAAGDSLTNIGKSFGISRDAVASRLTTLGVEIRPPGRPARATPEVLVRIIAMRDKGRAWSEISRDLGFKPRYLQVLYRAVKRVV